MIKKHTIVECPQVERLALLEKGQERIEHILDGNGQEGFIKKMVRMEEKVNTTYETVKIIEEYQDTLLEKISEALDYKKEQEAIVKDRGVRTVHLKWLIGTVIVLFLGVAGLILDNKKQNSKYNEILKVIDREDRSKNNLQR